MEQNLKSYLESMKLKTTVFGGYDPEDVILKMTEVANLAYSEAHQQCQQLEQKLSAQEEKLRQTEVSLKETSERLRQAETEKQHAEVELAQLRAQLAAKSDPAEETLFAQGSDAERLLILIASIEDAKADILLHCKEQAINDANRIREESSLMEQKCLQLRETLDESSHAMVLALDTLLEQAQQMRAQLLRLRIDENGTAEL